MVRSHSHLVHAVTDSIEFFSETEQTEYDPNMVDSLLDHLDIGKEENLPVSHEVTPRHSESRGDHAAIPSPSLLWGRGAGMLCSL